MNAAKSERETPDFQEVCNIVVLYENDGTRGRAMAACDCLVRQFWQEVELKFHWWRVDFLRDPQLAALASDSAVLADFLVISLERNCEFPPAMEAWFESWLARRPEQFGALVDLAAAASGGVGDSARERFLLEVCRRGKFDYLAALPSAEGNPPSNPQQFAVTGIVDDILGESRPPSHHGLNE